MKKGEIDEAVESAIKSEKATEIRKKESSKITNVEIDKSNIDEELCKQAANYLFVSEKAAEAEARHIAAKTQHEYLVAKLDGQLRKEFDDAGKKVTEKVIESTMLLHPDYQASRNLLNTLHTQKEVLKALKEAWWMRKDMLIRLAINQRAEIDMLGSETVREAA